jgi:hypothetical protein
MGITIEDAVGVVAEALIGTATGSVRPVPSAYDAPPVIATAIDTRANTANSSTRFFTNA